MEDAQWEYAFDFRNSEWHDFQQKNCKSSIYLVGSADHYNSCIFSMYQKTCTSANHRSEFFARFAYQRLCRDGSSCHEARNSAQRRRQHRQVLQRPLFRTSIYGDGIHTRLLHGKSGRRESSLWLQGARKDEPPGRGGVSCSGPRGHRAQEWGGLPTGRTRDSGHHWMDTGPQRAHRVCQSKYHDTCQ
jgi:hypothetical protein